MLISLLILWTLVTLLAGTSAIAIQSASRARLTAALKELGREKRLESFDKHRHQYALTALIFRQMGIVLFVVTLGVILPTAVPWWKHPAYLCLISAGWFLLFAAAIPTAWARYSGEAHIANVMQMLDLMRRLITPALWVMKGVDEVVRRLAGAEHHEAEQSMHAERAILDVVTHADVEGPVDETEKAMIKSVMAMDEKSAGQIMTPRMDIVGIEVASAYAEVRERALASAHSRMPVYEETLDHVIGVLFAKDLLKVENPETFSLREMMRTVPFVPETKDLASMLREFQSGRIHMAIVLDEYGGTSGLVTIEDVLEELVGEIVDEHDDPVKQNIQKLDDKTVDVDARVRVGELNEAMGISLPEDDAYDTIAGYVFSKLGKIPSVGDTVTADGVRVQVLNATERALVRLRVQIVETATTGAAA